MVDVADLAAGTIVMLPRSTPPGVWDRFCRHVIPGGTTGRDQIYTEPDLLNAPEAVLRAAAEGKGVGLTFAETG